MKRYIGILLFLFGQLSASGHDVSKANPQHVNIVCKIFPKFFKEEIAHAVSARTLRLLAEELNSEEERLSPRTLILLAKEWPNYSIIQIIHAKTLREHPFVDEDQKINRLNKQCQIMQNLSNIDNSYLHEIVRSLTEEHEARNQITLEYENSCLLLKQYAAILLYLKNKLLSLTHEEWRLRRQIEFSEIDIIATLEFWPWLCATRQKEETTTRRQIELEEELEKKSIKAELIAFFDFIKTQQKALLTLANIEDSERLEFQKEETNDYSLYYRNFWWLVNKLNKQNKISYKTCCSIS